MGSSMTFIKKRDEQEATVYHDSLDHYVTDFLQKMLVEISFNGRKNIDIYAIKAIKNEARKYTNACEEAVNVFKEGKGGFGDDEEFFPTFPHIFQDYEKYLGLAKAFEEILDQHKNEDIYYLEVFQ